MEKANLSAADDDLQPVCLSDLLFSGAKSRPIYFGAPEIWQLALFLYLPMIYASTFASAFSVVLPSWLNGRALSWLCREDLVFISSVRRDRS